MKVGLLIHAHERENNVVMKASQERDEDNGRFNQAFVISEFEDYGQLQFVISNLGNESSWDIYFDLEDELRHNAVENTVLKMQEVMELFNEEIGSYDSLRNVFPELRVMQIIIL